MSFSPLNRKVVLFDLDNTLYAYEQCDKVALQDVFSVWKKVFPESTEKDFLERYIEARSQIKRYLGGVASSHSRPLFFQKMVEGTDSGLQTDLILQLNESYWKGFYRTIKPFEGMKKTLLNLKERGFLLGCLTNMTAIMQYQKLSILGVGELFDQIITSEEVGLEKPNPLIFTNALNRFHIQPKDTYMIGDSFTDDIEPASLLGIHTIWFNPYKHPLPDKNSVNYEMVHSFDELLPILTRTATEGAIKYRLFFQKKSIFSGDDKQILQLATLRDKFYNWNMIGVYPSNHPKYANIGHGNLSQRYTKDGQFIITGSDTGKYSSLDVEHFALVTDFSIKENWVVAKGQTKASSESLTHAAIYAIAPEVKYVAHIHHTPLWKRFKESDIPSTSENIPYGTLEMGLDVQRVYREVGNNQLAVMLGHEDGLIAWASNSENLIMIFKTAMEKSKINPDS